MPQTWFVNLGFLKPPSIFQVAKLTSRTTSELHALILEPSSVGREKVIKVTVALGAKDEKWIEDDGEGNEVSPKPQISHLNLNP